MHPEMNEAARAATPATASETNQNLKCSPKSTATAVQLRVLPDLLKRRAHHTIELRRAGIHHPAGRVQDLLKRGYVIVSSRISAVDAEGRTHKGVALYSLISEPKEAA